MPVGSSAAVVAVAAAIAVSPATAAAVVAALGPTDDAGCIIQDPGERRAHNAREYEIRGLSTTKKPQPNSQRDKLLTALKGASSGFSPAEQEVIEAPLQQEDLDRPSRERALAQPQASRALATSSGN